jgi:phospholipase C
MKGQKLVADVYNAVRSNPDLWQTTLLVVVYDEHGGFYDHVEPPAATPPDDATEEYTFDRLGVRVPAVLISPHLRRGVVKTQLEHVSLLRLFMERWGVASLGRRTMGPDVLGDSLPWAPALRTDTIPFIRVPNSDLISKRPDWEYEDVTKHHEGLHLVADVLNATDDAIEGAVADAAHAAAKDERPLARLRAAMGDRLIAMGRALRRPLEKAAEARIDKSARAVWNIVNDKVRPS